MVRVASLLGFLVLLHGGVAVAGEPDWYEVKSPHFVVMANAGEGGARAVAGRFEQVRSAITAVCPWARVNPVKSWAVVAARDEATMKALLPSYWEDKKSFRPAAVWVEGPNRYYVMVRSDLRDDSEEDPTVPQNPYQVVYFAYVHTMLQASFPSALPPWFSRGFAAVLSNTNVQAHDVLVGAPLLSHITRLRDHPPLPLRVLLATTADDPALRQEDRLLAFDASAWAFVHFLLFADNGARRARIDTLVSLLQKGERPAAAVEESLGAVDKLQDEYGRYVSRSVFQYQKGKLDAAVKQEAFPVRRLAPAETAALRATVYAVTKRTSDAQRAIADARRLDANLASSYLAEGLLYDFNGQQAEARTAYEQAIAHGTDDPYAYYRCAVLNWPQDDNPDTLKRVEAWLAGATERNNQYATAYAALGQIRALLNHTAESSLPLVLRAIALEPNESESHRAAGATYLILRQLDKARDEAQIAARLARSDSEQRAAARLVSDIDNAKAAASSAEKRNQDAAQAAAAADDRNAKITACNGGTAEACVALLPFLESRCSEKDAGACGMLGWLYQTGHGVSVDPAQAAKWYRMSCDAGEQHACVSFALMQAHGQGVTKDQAAALELLEKGCAAAMPQACTQEAVLLASRQRASDKARIRTLLDAGCNGGDTPACDMLKSMPAR